MRTPSLVVISGDLLAAFDVGVNAIAHVTNCQGKMNSGVAKAIREAWPEAYESYKAQEARFGLRLGQVSEARQSTIFNMNSQEFYGYDGRRYLNYDAFFTACESVALRCKALKYKAVGIPFRMGCDRAGGNWKIVSTILEETIVARGMDVIAFDNSKL